MNSLSKIGAVLALSGALVGCKEDTLREMFESTVFETPEIVGMQTPEEIRIETAIRLMILASDIKELDPELSDEMMSRGLDIYDKEKGNKDQ